jgi:hypothetical protein
MNNIQLRSSFDSEYKGMVTCERFAAQIARYLLWGAGGRSGGCCESTVGLHVTINSVCIVSFIAIYG